MSTALFFVLYCAVCFVVSAVTARLVKVTWLYFLISATIPAVLFIGGASVWRGYLTAWSDVAFVLSWLLALCCSIAYHVARRLSNREERIGGKPANPDLDA